MIRIILDRIPLPPSENNCYPTNRKTGRRFPSGELKKFQADMQTWRAANLRIANQARDLLVARNPAEQRPIRIDRYFAFRRDRLYTLSGGAKKLDAANRIKPLDDALCEHVLGIDDCWFWSGSATKFVSNSEECCLVVLEHYQPTTLELARSFSDDGYPLVLRW